MKPRHRPAELPEAAVPVGEFAQFALQIQIEFVNDARIQPHARHQDEMAARLVGPFQSAQRDAHGHRVQKLRAA